MTRLGLVGLAIAAMIASPALAAADPDDSGEPMFEVAATANVCDQVRERFEATEATCKVIAMRRLMHGHAAMLVVLRGDTHAAIARYLAPEVAVSAPRLTRYVIVVDAAEGRRWLSPSLDYLEGTETPATPVVRAITTGGRLAVVVDVSATYARSASDRSPTRVFLGCRQVASGEWTCLREDIQSADLADCAVALTATGVVTVRCERRTQLKLEADLVAFGDGISARVMSEVAPGDSRCEIPELPEGAQCDVIARRSLGKLGRIALIKTSSFDVGYQLLAEIDGQLWLSPSIGFSGVGCGMHKCDGFEDPAASLRRITIDGRPAFVVEAQAVQVHEQHDPNAERPDGITRTRSRSLLVCGIAAPRNCLVLEGVDAAVSATGMVTIRSSAQIDLAGP
jgi:hypothetical protein